MSNDPSMPEKDDQILDQIESREEEWIEILTDLISIPSTDPPGDTRDIAAYLTDLFDDAGIEYEIIAPREDMPNIVAQIGGEDEHEEGHLVFNGHLDTFGVDDRKAWDTDPFEGILKDERIYGRGAADMHGGFTATLAAFLVLAEHEDDLNGTITFTAVSHEESGGKWGAEYIVDNHPEYRGDALLNGEPSSPGLIIFAEKGHLWFKVDVLGESNHSALPGGISATEILSELIVELKGLENSEELYTIPEDVKRIFERSREQLNDFRGFGTADYLMKPTVNVGKFSGGEKINLVASRASAEIDIRLPSGASTDTFIEEIQKMVDDTPGEVSFSVISKGEPLYSNIEKPIFSILQETAAEIRGGDAPVFTGSPPISDSRFYRGEGIPSMNYGPTAHNVGKPNEFIERSDFEVVTKVHALTAARFINLI